MLMDHGYVPPNPAVYLSLPTASIEKCTIIRLCFIFISSIPQDVLIRGETELHRCQSCLGVGCVTALGMYVTLPSRTHRRGMHASIIYACQSSRITSRIAMSREQLFFTRHLPIMWFNQLDLLGLSYPTSLRIWKRPSSVHASSRLASCFGTSLTHCFSASRGMMAFLGMFCPGSVISSAAALMYVGGWGGQGQHLCTICTILGVPQSIADNIHCCPENAQVRAAEARQRRSSSPDLGPIFALNKR